MTERARGVSRSVSALFVYLLIGLFTLLSLLLVLIGVGAYQGIARDTGHDAQMRTSLSYIVSKIHASDETGAISVEEIQGIPVLALRQGLDDEYYLTRIYCLPDGAEQEAGLYELFTPADEEPSLEDGQRIAEVAALDVRERDGAIDLRVTMPDGYTRRVSVSRRSAR